MGDQIVDDWRALPTLGEIYSYQAAIEREALSSANLRYAYALERRDKLFDRVRFGSLALNGATLAALLGVLGDAKTGLQSLGVTDSAIRTAFILLVIGMMQSAVAVWWSGICFTKWAGDEVGRLQKARHRAALMEQKRSEQSDKELSDMVGEARQEGGFESSRIDVMLSCGGGSFWIGAMCSLIWPILVSLPRWW